MSANSWLTQNWVASSKSLADLASGSHSNSWRLIFGKAINDWKKEKKDSLILVLITVHVFIVRYELFIIVLNSFAYPPVIGYQLINPNIYRYIAGINNNYVE